MGDSVGIPLRSTRHRLPSGLSFKYLSATVKRVTGHSVSSYIDRHTIPILKNFLEDERLSLTQIAERMNFTTLPYFRDCRLMFSI